jgi:alcohol dehydrogenase (cytochrome c)
LFHSTLLLLALDLDTGRLKWHFQFTPHDLFDYDATETPVLLDSDDQGQPRKLIVEANRNVFFYVLDRANGKFLSAFPFVKRLNWAKSADAQGRPVLTGLQSSSEGTEICPGFTGATNWFSPSYNPATHLFYFLALEDCGTFFRKPEKFEEGRAYYSTGVRRVRREKILLTYNLDGSLAWQCPQAGDGNSGGGTMTTAGAFLLFGDDSESFEAVDAKTGKPLWHFTTGQRFRASPMSYAVLGKQYIAVASASDIFSFVLP